MNDDRIAELLSPFIQQGPLSRGQFSAVQSYLEMLLKWNSKINLTAIRNSDEIVTRHFGESLFAAFRIFPNQNSTASVIDIGSGAGFPGLPIKIWAPGVSLTLIESNQRKATFLREVVRALNLPQIEVVMDRAEKLPIQAEVVTLRAVERFERVLPIVPRLLRPNGQAALLIGSAQVEVAKAALPLHWQEPIPIPLSRSRVLLLGRAQSGEF